MKCRSIGWFTVLILLVGVAGCGEPAEPAPLATANPDPAEVTLMPYTSQTFGFTGVAPAGWVEFSPGHFQPAMPSTAPTLFGQVGLPVAAEMLAELAGLPESTGRRETSDLSWDLYAWDLEAPDETTIHMEFALAEENGGLYVVLLGALAQDHEGLRDALFLPALEALQPAAVTAAETEDQPRAMSPLALSEGPAPIDTRLRLADGMVMVYVPAGDFPMGEDAVWRWSGSLQDGTLGLGALTDQHPQHSVYLDAFWIDQTEVTVAMFRAFVEATGYETAAERQGYGHPYKAGPQEQEWPQVAGADWQHPRGPGSEAQDNHPVVQVSWDDAAAYCAWVGGALPTEAQWEKACRGTDGRAYPWGNAFDEGRMNYCEAQCPVTRWNQEPTFDDGYAYTAPVGSYPAGASPYGALDMSGNVWEWTADRYDADYYADAPAENPQGPSRGYERVQHGGAWYDTGQGGWLTCTIRHATLPGNTADDLGFRCAVPDNKAVAFTGIHLVPMTGEAVVVNQTVLVEGATIVAIGDADALPIPADAQVIDGEGAYLMPGLADMHMHTRQNWEDGDVWPVHPLHLYLANGVTTVRDLGPQGSPLTYALQWREEIRAGTRHGPTIYASGKLLYASPLEDPAGIVQQNYDLGFDFLKAYSYLSREDYHEAMVTARELGMYTTGHVPYAVGLEGVLGEGMDEIAHVEELLPEFIDFDRSRDLAPAEWLPYLAETALGQWDLSSGGLPAGFEAENRETLAHIAGRLRSAGVPVCTTLVIDETIQWKLFRPAEFLARPENVYQERGYLESIRQGEEKHQVQFAGREGLAAAKYDIDRWLLVGLHEAGVGLLLGTDSGTGGMGIVPGYSIHDELRILVENGFSPYEAIATGTVNAALVVERMTGEGSFGTIEEGKRADLILVEDNPLEDVATIREPLGVMAAGRWYPQASLADLSRHRVE
jgi:formylglycine-generating enzyme required for sulfatase activity